MRHRILLALAILLGACGREPAEQTPPDASYRDAYAGIGPTLPERLRSGECTVFATCGAYSVIDCGSQVDGPAYFVETETLRVLETCGGACMMGENQDGHCVDCSPPEWTCP